MWTHLEIKLLDWEKRFVSIWSKKTQDYLDIDRKYVEEELPLLKAEKHASEMRLRKIEELIAKVEVLIGDLNEDLCRKFSGGCSLAVVGEVLLTEFGSRLKEYHSKGRREIREFLEEHYRIGKVESRDLFSLLEELGTVYYQVDLPDGHKDIPLVFHSYEGELHTGAAPEVIYQLDGWWEIRA